MEMSYNIITKNLGEDYKNLCRSNSNYYMPFLTMDMESKNKSAYIVYKLENKKKNIRKELTSLLNIDTVGNNGKLLKLNGKQPFRKLSFINNLKKPLLNYSKKNEAKINKIPKTTIIKEFKFATSNNHKRINKNLNSANQKFETHIKKIKVTKSNNNTGKNTTYNTRASSAFTNDTKTQNLKFIIKSNNSDINITNNNNSYQIKTEKQMFELRKLLLKKSNSLIKTAYKNSYNSEKSNIKNKTRDEIIANQFKKKLNKLQRDFENKLISQSRDMHDLLPNPKDIEYFDMRKLKRYRDDSKCEYVWMKKSTVNLISFGDALNKMEEDEFIKNQGKIMKQYPKLQKDAEIYVKRNYLNYNQKKMVNQIEKNSRKIDDMFYNSQMRIKRIIDKIKENKTNSALF